MYIASNLVIPNQNFQPRDWIQLQLMKICQALSDKKRDNYFLLLERVYLKHCKELERAF